VGAARPRINTGRHGRFRWSSSRPLIWTRCRYEPLNRVRASGARLQQKPIDLWRCTTVCLPYGTILAPRREMARWPPCRSTTFHIWEGLSRPSKLPGQRPVPDGSRATWHFLNCVHSRPNVPIDIDVMAAQIFGSRLRYLQLLATARIVMARADATLRAAPRHLQAMERLDCEVRSSEPAEDELDGHDQPVVGRVD
jgi:hypothetical protein